MTENWLDYDQKIFTMTNHIFFIWPNLMTPTNINFTPKKYAGVVGLDRSPSPGIVFVWSQLDGGKVEQKNIITPACKLTLAGTPAQPC